MSRKRYIDAALQINGINWILVEFTIWQILQTQSCISHSTMSGDYVGIPCCNLHPKHRLLGQRQNTANAVSTSRLAQTVNREERVKLTYRNKIVVGRISVREVCVNNRAWCFLRIQLELSLLIRNDTNEQTSIPAKTATPDPWRWAWIPHSKQDLLFWCSKMATGKWPPTFSTPR